MDEPAIQPQVDPAPGPKPGRGPRGPRARRAHGEGSVYPDSSRPGVWRGSVDVTGPDGKRRRRYFRGPTEADVRRRVRAAVAAHERGELTHTRSPTLAEWLHHWHTTIAPARCQPTTLDRYRTVIEQWIVPLIGRRRLDALTPDDIRTVHKAMHAEGRYSSARQAHSVLRRALKVAVAEGRAPRNPAALIDGPTYERPDVTPLTRTEAAAVIAEAEARGELARWAIALTLGMRQGEVLGLTWDAVDTDDRTIRIGIQLQVRRYRHQCGAGDLTGDLTAQGRARQRYPCGRAQPIQCPSIPEALRAERLYLTTPKTRSSRRPVPFPAELVPLLQEHRRAQRVRYLESGVRPGWVTTPVGATGQLGKPTTVDLVFARPDGRPLDPHDDRDAWVALLKAAGVPAARLHNARHTAATVMLELGVPPKMVSEILGHSSSYFTQDTYQHWVESSARDAADAMGGALLRPASEPSPRRRSGGRR